MIVTCPACSTRYLVDPKAISADGRRVRCASCGHEWRQAAPPKEELSDAPPIAPPPRREHPVRRQRANLPAIREKPRRQTLIIAGAAAAVVVLILLALIFRTSVVGMWPATAGLYGTLGLAVEVDEPQQTETVEEGAPASAADMLAFRNLSLRLTTENGVPVLTVSGEVVNLGTATYEVPPVEAILLDENKDELYSWTFEPPVEELLAGDHASFSTQLSNPPNAVREAVLEFLPGDMPQDETSRGTAGEGTN